VDDARNPVKSYQSSFLGLAVRYFCCVAFGIFGFGVISFLLILYLENSYEQSILRSNIFFCLFILMATASLTISYFILANVPYKVTFSGEYLELRCVLKKEKITWNEIEKVKKIVLYPYRLSLTSPELGIFFNVIRIRHKSFLKRYYIIDAAMKDGDALDRDLREMKVKGVGS